MVGSLFTCPSAGPPQQPFFLFCTLARASDNGRFECIRSQDTGRQAFERGRADTEHPPRSLSYGFFTAARVGTGGSSRSSVRTSLDARTIKKPVEGRFSPLQRSAIPLLVGPRLQS